MDVGGAVLVRERGRRRAMVVVGQPSNASSGRMPITRFNYASWNIVTSYAWPEKLSVLLMNATVSGLAFTEIWEYVFLLRQRCWLEQPRWCSYALDCGAPAASLLRQ